MPHYAFIDVFLHLDAHLLGFIAAYGHWTYALVFLIVFFETGLVVTPFLPGDSLLFALGSFAAQPDCILDVGWLMLGLSIAAIVGNSVNYYIGRWIGPRVFSEQRRWFFNAKQLATTQAFYMRHGGKALFLGRFFPVIRTFVPFVAGIGKMPRLIFTTYNVVSACVWVGTLLGLGFFFGEIPFIKQHFSWMIVALLVVPLGISVVATVYARVNGTARVSDGGPFETR